MECHMFKTKVVFLWLPKIVALKAEYGIVTKTGVRWLCFVESIIYDNYDTKEITYNSLKMEQQNDDSLLPEG